MFNIALFLICFRFQTTLKVVRNTKGRLKTEAAEICPQLAIKRGKHGNPHLPRYVSIDGLLFYAAEGDVIGAAFCTTGRSTHQCGGILTVELTFDAFAVAGGVRGESTVAVVDFHAGTVQRVGMARHFAGQAAAVA